MKAFPQFLNPRFLIVNMGILFLLACSAAPLSAQTAWNGGGDGVSWSDADNWSAGAPSVGQQTQFRDGGLLDVPITVTVDTITPIKALYFDNSSNRSVTLNSGTLNLETALASSAIYWNGSADTAAVTINSDVNFSNSVDGDDATLYVNMVARPITFNGNITTSGSGGRTMQLAGAGTVTINGSNATSYMKIGNTGELIAGSTSALGSGYVYKTSTATISFRSDVTVTGLGNTYSWLQNNVSGLRISELASSSTDYTLTLNDRIAGTGTFQFLDNINSTGNLILEMKYSGGNAQSLDLETNETSIIRFAQAADTTYSGLISGGGRLQKTSGTGTTTLSAVNTYTGKTTISTGTLLLSGEGSISASSEINVASSGIFSVASITGGSYTLESGQTLSGEGTVATGGKNLIMNGTLAPGSSPGTLTVDLGVGTFSLGADTDLQFELGTASDLVNLTSGTLNIGSATLGFDDFSFTGGAGFGVGQYTLFQTTKSILGTFAGNTSGTVGSFNGVIKFSGNDLILDVSVIPEPGTASLLLLGGFSALLLVRRKSHCVEGENGTIPPRQDTKNQR